MKKHFEELVRANFRFGRSCFVTPALPSSPFAAFLLLQGVETLSLRLERHAENTKKVVEFLVSHPMVEHVNHPSLTDHPDHALYEKYFPNGGGSVFTFEIRGGVKAAH